MINGMYIDPLIFTQKFVKSCDVCICSGECCYYGVYTDKSEHELIMSLKDRIIKSMDDSQTKDVEKWFEDPEPDDDFPSGIAVGTEVHNGKCVFLDRQGYCTLQKIAMEDGEFKWKYKPLYCILFPLVIFEGVLTVDDEHLDRMHYCNKPVNQISTVFDCCKNELKHVLGEEGFKELEAYREEFFSKSK
ncbi:MAG: hypothetical protein A2499_04610 [Stygiobacter sp. RIFOXYC12_FULL_38_8]|nr:MAG: hypothetical protein A2X62_06985 [Stygiobacter sp. GWC2_38_9]OGU84546.1 MAG: hypothetical protein A2279_09175 [Stygiobacter sp. RIFOXYA12_FULL_38_9]OGV08300.1 MAG: hypothetical protein A2299_19260 [Stygiobacter sp. RIFOXYB2_FULL_37_11]OGV15385.1 MAG: hypothetical protein A2440_07405 [Stygiobacter sp. RIFOXYC2_FULL_38_25]OGV30110.1 MAG: hypothetical protein A2499_04610 [Stygiobacter sp. RIFOXYC12_FULL_38_8]OGV79123.1 MAG: hypothetical protein A2X65_07855 [Stygiobacter sp. GWF2_38_21]